MRINLIGNFTSNTGLSQDALLLRGIFTNIYGDKVQIEFLMDGTEQDIEEEIVEECYNLLKYYGLPNLRINFKFTTDGNNFYEYN